MAGRNRGDARPPRGLSADDLALWRRATRRDSRLPGRNEPDLGDAAEAAEPNEPHRRIPRRRAPADAGPALPPLAHAPAAGVDARTAQRLRRGVLPIEARLDLHGKTQAEAHAALDRFLAQAQAAGKRCVLVITGKGARRAEGEDAGPGSTAAAGVLKRAVPLWLDQAPNRARVIAIAPARPQHGGDGALYVLLRKARG